jgi:hypothetical protein
VRKKHISPQFCWAGCKVGKLCLRLAGAKGGASLLKVSEPYFNYFVGDRCSPSLLDEKVVSSILEHTTLNGVLRQKDQKKEYNPIP